jgi:alkaline phosphatase
MATLLIPAAATAKSPRLFDPPWFSSGDKVKNVIVMISDGCGYEHITATDYYQYGRTNRQVYQRFPVSLGMSTYEYEGSAGSHELHGYDPHLAFNRRNFGATSGKYMQNIYIFS